MSLRRRQGDPAMSRRSSGQVLTRRWKGGRGYALRFHAYGRRQYLTLGSERDGWSPRRAQEELENVMADVRRGLWVEPEKEPPAVTDEAAAEDPRDEAILFGPFALDLVEARRGQVSDSQIEHQLWALSHLRPHFAETPLHEIDVRMVDAYRADKVAESAALERAIERGIPKRDAAGRIRRPLGAGTINKTLDVLQWVLGYAVEYGHMPDHRNPAEGRRRRLPTPRRRPVHLDSAEQIEALLEAAAELDRRPSCLCSNRRAVVATLLFAGPRADELCGLLWRDIDLDNGRISIGRSKTQAGLREIMMVPVLREILASHRAAAGDVGPDDLVFPTLSGSRNDVANLRNRTLGLALRRADEILEGQGRPPLPVGVTPHKLRHTFASVLIACGEDPASVMAQLGHTDPKFTLKVYTHLMRRGPEERARLKALMAGEGTSSEAEDASGGQEEAA
jgi:integrase